MARNKTEKTTISFEKPELIKRLVGDIAIKENRSLSAIIEKIVLESLLPKNSDAKWIAEHYLYGENGGIGKALSATFEMNSAGINWGTKYGDLFPLVRFASTQEVFCGVPLTGEEVELHHTSLQIQSVIERLNIRASEAEEAGDAEKKQYYLKEADWGCELLRELEEEPQMSHLINFYKLLMNSWEDFKDWSITYRLLKDLVDLEKGWRNDPEANIELLFILKTISENWTADLAGGRQV